MQVKTCDWTSTFAFHFEKGITVFGFYRLICLHALLLILQPSVWKVWRKTHMPNTNCSSSKQFFKKVCYYQHTRKKNAAFPFQHISNHLARIKQNQQLFPLYVELSHQDKKRCSQNSSREYRACITNKIDDLLSKNPYKKLQTTSVSYEYRQKTIGHSLFIFSSKPFRLATFYSH